MPISMPRRFAVLLVAMGLLAGCAHAPGRAVLGPAPGPPATALVTGSRIPQPVDPATGRPLTASSVRIYTSEELVRTGAPDLARALRLLGPGGL